MRSLRKRLRPRRLVVYTFAVGLLWVATPRLETLLLGLVPIAAGEGLRVWATGYLHKTDALTVAGPYAYLRHPLYLGTLLIATGFALMAWSWIAVALYCVFCAAYFGYYMPYKNRIESARLESLYGEAFRRYRTAVPRLLPRALPYHPLAAEASGSVAWRLSRFRDNNELGTALGVSCGVLGMALRWTLI